MRGCPAPVSSTARPTRPRVRRPAALKVDRMARWASHDSTARRRKSVTSSSSASPRPPSPACNSATFGSRPCGVVRHHAAGLPVPGQHHVGGRSTPTGKLRRQPDPTRVRGYPALDASSRAAAAVNRSPTICADSGTTRSAGSGLTAARSVWRARATPPFTNPHVVHLALLVRLAAAHGDEDPVAVGGIDDVGPAQRAHLATPQPGHEQQSRDHRI